MSISGISGISKSLGSLNYDGDKARRDLIAGLTVAAVSLPQGITYALVAGVDPKFGVYSAIVVTFVASVFGSSSHLVNGPTSAISLLVFSSLAFLDPEIGPFCSRRCSCSACWSARSKYSLPCSNSVT